MQNRKLLVIIACLMLTISFAFPAFAAQPPIDTTTFYEGTIGQPRRVDPARAYDTASGELIMNVYQPLIFFSDKPDTPETTTFISEDLYADLSAYTPVLATALPTMSPDGLEWTFTIRSGVKWHPWTAANGTVITGQLLTAEDVEYTFERAFIQDQIGSPMWMFTMPMFGYMWSSYDGGYTAADEAELGTMFADSVTRSGNTVTFHFQQDWPDVALMQIFAQTWGCIVNKAWAIEHGCWDGSFAAGWYARFHAKPSNSYSPLDNFYAAESKYTAADSVPAMCGTGPYKFNYWNKATLEWRIDRFDDYWGGWAGTHLDTIICKGVAEWSTRKMQFLAGEFDVCAVPRANMWDLLADPEDPYLPLPGIKLYYGQGALSNDVFFPVLDVADDSPYMSKIPAGGDPAPELFANAHMRAALAYALDWELYLRDAWFNEAVQPATWWVAGLKPDYEDKSIVKFAIDLARVEAELKAAVFDGESVWDTGFSTYILYNLGNDQRKIAAELVRDTIMSLNAKRAGKPPIDITVVGLDWPVFLDYEEQFWMPVFFVGWLADFADADNFARPYMHSGGDFAYYQAYNNPHVDELINEGIITPDGPARQAIYYELQAIYHDDVVSIPLIQALGRTWFRDWCRGYYYNQLYPGAYFYDRYKEVGAPVQPIDIDITDSIQAVGGAKLRRTPNGAKMTTLSVTVSGRRTDSNAGVAAAFVIVALNRTSNPSKIIYGADVFVTLTLASPSFEEVLLWNETGAECPAAGNYTISAVVNVISSFAYDNNLANNFIVSGGGPVEVTVLIADVNNDGIVNILDIFQAATAFGSTPDSARWNALVDFNGDSIINILDIFQIATNFGKTL